MTVSKASAYIGKTWLFLGTRLPYKVVTSDDVIHIFRYWEIQVCHHCTSSPSPPTDEPSLNIEHSAETASSQFHLRRHRNICVAAIGEGVADDYFHTAACTPPVLPAYEHVNFPQSTPMVISRACRLC